MESSPVIVLLDEGLDVAMQVSEIPIPVRIDLLPLQCVQKTLAAGVVVRVSAELSALCLHFGTISSSRHSCIKRRAYTYRTTTLVYLPLELCFESTTWSGTVYALLEQHRDVQRDTYIHCIMKLESKLP
jgi:hypothetical protein